MDNSTHELKMNGGDAWSWPGASFGRWSGISPSNAQPSAPPAAPTTSNASPDEPPSYFAYLRAGDLQIDRKYQPKDRYDERKAERIAKEWDWTQYEPVKVGIYEDGSAWLIDGQHRLKAALMRFGDDVQLPCYVVGQVSVEDAALIFANADKNRTRLATHHKFAALLTAQDAEALRIVETLRRHGWNLVTNGSTSAGNVACVATVQRLYRDAKGGPERLDQTMRVIAQAWGTHQPKAVSAIVIGGVGRFLKLYAKDPRFDEGHLVKRLRETVIEELLGPEAGAIAVQLGMRVGDQNNLAVAYAIRDRYNHNRRKHLRIGPRDDE